MAALVDAIIKEMLVPLDEEFLGPVKHIYCYCAKDGSCPSREFLDGAPKVVQATYRKQFEKMAQGLHLRGDRWHPWSEEDCKGCKGLAAYKDISSKSRIVHLTEHYIHVLLFGFNGKKEDKIAGQDVRRALSLKDEYMVRRGEVERRLKGKGQLND